VCAESQSNFSVILRMQVSTARQAAKAGWSGTHCAAVVATPPAVHTGTAALSPCKYHALHVVATPSATKPTYARRDCSSAATHRGRRVVPSAASALTATPSVGGPANELLPGFKVVIAGAGISGLTLALGLLRKGIRVTVLERDLTAIRGEGKLRGPIQVGWWGGRGGLREPRADQPAMAAGAPIRTQLVILVAHDKQCTSGSCCFCCGTAQGITAFR
jgi:hypothetical protein